MPKSIRDALWSLAISVALLAPSSVAADHAYYVSTDGKAENSGTAESPWDIASALAGQHPIAPGSTLLLEGGVYRHPDRTWTSPGFAIALEGTAGHPIRIRPVGGVRVTLDGRVEVKPNSRYLRVEDLEITVTNNILYETPLQLGYSAPYNEDAVVRDNWIVLAGMSIQKFRKVEQSGNVIISAKELDADRPADVFIRPNKYDSRRFHIAVINWSRAPTVKVDLGAALKPGSHYRIVNVLEYYGPAIAEGTYDGQNLLMLTMPDEDRTDNGQFCAFVLFSNEAK